jgi:hypothetical protein
MQIRVLKIVALITLTTILISCNGSGSSKTDNKGDFKLTIPTKIDVENPTLLKQDRSQKGEIVAEGYQDLKESISQLEDNKQTLKIDLILLNQLTDEINGRCGDIPLNTPCLIEENQLHFTYNDEVIEELVKLMGEESREHISKIEGRKIPLGEVKFTKYSNAEKYQYQIDLEYIPDIKHLIYTNESVRWSKDEKRVYSFYSSISDKDRYSFGIDFSQGSSGAEKMVLNGVFYGEYDIDGSVNSFQNSYKLQIEKLNDKYNSFNILFSSDSNFTDEGEVDNYSSITTGSISDLNGSLLIVSKNGNGGVENSELDIFDGNGTLISSKYETPSL